jgi:hypothetical protein
MVPTTPVMILVNSGRSARDLWQEVAAGVLEEL